MFRLQVRFRNEWRWGIVEYATEEEAKERVETLKRVGIKARVRKNEELFN